MVCKNAKPFYFTCSIFFFKSIHGFPEVKVFLYFGAALLADVTCRHPSSSVAKTSHQSYLRADIKI